MELRLLEPGKQATYNFQLDSRLKTGVYRFQTRLYDGNTLVTSNTIEIR
jgi:hypothetical protein